MGQGIVSTPYGIHDIESGYWLHPCQCTHYYTCRWTCTSTKSQRIGHRRSCMELCTNRIAIAVVSFINVWSFTMTRLVCSFNSLPIPIMSTYFNTNVWSNLDLVQERLDLHVQFTVRHWPRYYWLTWSRWSLGLLCQILRQWPNNTNRLRTCWVWINFMLNPIPGTFSTHLEYHWQQIIF